MTKTTSIFIAIALLLISYATAQTQDVKHIYAHIELMPNTKTIKAEMTVSINVLKPTDTVFLNARDINFENITYNEDTIDFTTDKSVVYVLKPFNVGNHTLNITYTASPKQTLYFVNDRGIPEIFTQGQGKYTSHWLPSIDDMTDKIEFDLTIKAPRDLTVISNGTLTSKEEIDNFKTWQFDMKQPMSSYLVALIAGNYDIETIYSTSKIPLKLYYEPNDINYVESTYRYSKTIFDFLETEIGVSYPWQNYKQVYVKDFLYAGMENTTTTVFSNAFVVDSIGFIDRNYVNVNAHELAHQWFGNLVTEESSAHHWLHEGFATYYALLAERALFGDAYYYWKLYESAEQLKKLSDQGKGEALTNPKASSLTFYEKGAWALHILREIVGDKNFKLGVKTYLETYKFQNVTINDFITTLEKTSGKDLSSFEKNWLNQSAFKAKEALESLSKSTFMQRYFEVSRLRDVPFAEKEKLFFQLLADPELNTYIGQDIVLQLSNNINEESTALLKMAFDTNNILIRQAIVANIKDIPKGLQNEFESLLGDDSYQTKELALFSLWQNFPKKRIQYLNRLKGIEGFADKNIELLWLTLSIVTSDYEPQNTQKYLNQLEAYTDGKYSYQIRQNAFNYLYQIEAFSNISLRNLVSATTHHVWRFKKLSRELLGELLKNSKYKKQVFQLKSTFSKEAQDYLDRIL